MKGILFTLLVLSFNALFCQTLLIPDQVFDGQQLHSNWVVLVENNTITFAGNPSRLKISENTNEIKLLGMTLMPGLIEGHSHLLLHPYNETTWNDQVLKESPVERSIRGTVHAKKSLLAGITSMRDLGAEGAGYAGGIVSAAIDGERCAMKIASKFDLKI